MKQQNLWTNCYRQDDPRSKRLHLYNSELLWGRGFLPRRGDTFHRWEWNLGRRSRPLISTPISARFRCGTHKAVYIRKLGKIINFVSPHLCLCIDWNKIRRWRSRPTSLHQISPTSVRRVAPAARKTSILPQSNRNTGLCASRSCR